MEVTKGEITADDHQRAWRERRMHDQQTKGLSA
jgi:hypothetical protein